MVFSVSPHGICVQRPQVREHRAGCGSRFNLWFHIYDEERCEAAGNRNPFLEAQLILCGLALFTDSERRVQQALEAGKHALTEKPLAISVDEVDRLIALAAKQKLVLGVFFEMRYAPAHDIAKRLVQAGAIGNIIGIRIQTLIDKSMTYWQSGYAGRSVNPWRGIKQQAGGGVVLMNASHLLDAVMYVTGLKVTSVAADVGTLVANVEVEDLASATLRFDNGALLVF